MKPQCSLSHIDVNRNVHRSACELTESPTPLAWILIEFTNPKIIRCVPIMYSFLLVTHSSTELPNSETRNHQISYPAVGDKYSRVIRRLLDNH